VNAVPPINPNPGCFISGHAWMKFENDEWEYLVCARPACRIKVKIKKNVNIEQTGAV